MLDKLTFFVVVADFRTAPEFVQRLNVFEEVEQGGGLGFECQVRGFPRPVVKWFKDDVEVPPSQSEDGRIAAEEWPPVDASTSVSVSAGGGSGSIIVLLRLVIRDARKDDEGAYRCKAENEEGVAATTGYLSITGVLLVRSPCGGCTVATTIRLQFDGDSTRPRYDLSTIYFTTGLLHCYLNM